jgi:ATP-dependent DNA ligase
MPLARSQIPMNIETSLTVDEASGPCAVSLSHGQAAYWLRSSQISANFLGTDQGEAMSKTVAIPAAPTSPIDLVQKAETKQGMNPEQLGDHWTMEPKWDGWRLLAHVTETGVHLYTPTGNVQDGKLLEIEAELSRLPAGTWIDGEAVALMLDGDMVVHEWNAVQKCLGCSDLTKARARSGPITFVAFDLISHADIDARSLPFVKRRDLLERVLDQHSWERVILTPQVAPTDEHLASFIAQGFEGGVAKSLTAPYASGQRGQGQIKFKPQATDDFVVMGFKEGENGFTGLIGAIVFGAYENGELVERGRCSGMDMATRVRISKDRDSYLGNVLEVAHMGFIGAGYRHPQFKRWRPDKAPAECVV